MARQSDGTYLVDPGRAGAEAAFSVPDRIEASDFDTAGAAAIGDFDLTHDSSEPFRIRPDNVFQVKVNYWLNF